MSRRRRPALAGRAPQVFTPANVRQGNAQEAGDLMALRHKKGGPGELRDSMIAGIVLACHATLATRNISHFEDLSIPVVNPWAT